MSIKKGVTALAVGSLVCITLSSLRSPAVARQEEKKKMYPAEKKKMHPAAATITKAVAILLATKGNKVEGRVTFTEAENGIHVKGELSGLCLVSTASTSTNSVSGRPMARRREATLTPRPSHTASAMLPNGTSATWAISRPTRMATP